MSAMGAAPARFTMMRIKLDASRRAAVAAVWLAAAGCSAGATDDERSGQTQLALTASQERVLGFEAPASDWTSSRTISASSTASQGTSSLAITPNGYVEVQSVALSSLGPVKSQIGFDLRLPQALAWGEARLVISVPSKGISSQDLGGVALSSLPAGSFNKVSFALPSAVEAALEGTYSDLRLRIVLNTPNTSAPLLLDRFDVSESVSTPAPGNALKFTYPKGQALSSVFLSASDRLQLDERVTLSNASAPRVFGGLGSGGVQVGAGTQLYGNLFSGAAALLRSGSHVYGSVTAAGGVTRESGALVDGSTTQNTPVPVETTTVNVIFPPAGSAKTVGPDGPVVTLPPGSYASLDVRARGRVSLAPGSYYFGTFNSEPQAEIQLTGSPIYIYASGGFTYKGGFKRLGGADGQVLVGYLGTSTAFFQAPFVGTLVAPNATVELQRPDTGQHRGAFFGKNIRAFSDASIGHLPFTAPVVCSNCVCDPGYSGPNCEKFCASTRDSDGDGVLDCDDGCPLHAGKTTEGKCGCAVADTDTDGDGTPNCRDLCPRDPAHIEPAACGCLEDSTYRSQGTPCATPFCPGASTATCNATAVCGDPNACKPEANCTALETSASNYFICAGRTWQQAASSCAARGMRLARIDTVAENERLRGILPLRTWIGGNALGTAGAWRWAEDPTGAGEQFWMGGAQGSVLNNRFVSWSKNAPGTQRCLSLDPKDGRWSDHDCNAALPYVCEFVPPGRVGPALTLAIASQPDPLVCPPPASNMPPEPLDLEAMREDARKADEEGRYEGAAANPPTRGTKPCPPELATDNSCRLKDLIAKVVCTSDEMCREYGPQYVCRLVKESPFCSGPDAVCDAEPRCGVLDCLRDGATDCEQIDVCGGEDATTFESKIDPGSNLAPESPNPASFYTKAPDFTNSTVWLDPAPVDPNGADARNGVKHLWCKLKPQQTDKVQPAELKTAKQGKSGSGSPIDFTFDPNLRFDARPNPLALGESNMKLLAEASLDSNVVLTSFLRQPRIDLPILHASAGVVVERCRIKTSDSKLRLFGLDFTDQLPASLKFDTDALKGADGSYPGSECSRALAQFQEAADRVKKAFHDAREVLTQYRNLKQQGLQFRGDFCQKLGITNPLLAGFPGGNVCPDEEPVELTIDRLLWYYQGDDGSGQLDGMASAASGLADVTGKLLRAVRTRRGALEDATSFKIPLVLPTRTETKNLFTTTFPVGPVFITVEVDTAASYGLDGSVDFGVTFPTSLNGSMGDLSNPDSPKPASLAHARVSVEPYAAAGMSLYAAIGGRYASAGVEGAINIARIRAPFRAGVGLGCVSVADTREPPASMTALALQGVRGIEDAMPFGKGRSYRFYLTHDYGAAIRLEDILSGTINAKLRLRFGFFSRTWRTQIYSFKGLDDLTFNLLQGSGRAELFTVGDSRIENANDVSGMGISEPQVPILLFEPLPLPSETTPAPNGEADFIPGELGRPFYDDLCCSAVGQPCGTVDTPGCCGDLQCVGGGSAPGTCTECQPTGAACDAYHPCCSGNDCNGGVCGACQTLGNYCDENADCCDGSYCSGDGRCVPGL